MKLTGRISMRIAEPLEEALNTRLTELGFNTDEKMKSWLVRRLLEESLGLAPRKFSVLTKKKKSG